MNEVIKKVIRGYKMDKKITILRCANDAVLIAENKWSTHVFDTIEKRYSTISAEETKCMTTAKELQRCKIETDEQMMQQ